ncbi:unnamed protein product [Cyclocybe aegerita]|uniref:IucC family-domain-containing protein n=1 Tax=Cyclocybe aegerita TaxID=1973307 RepID=A0A8S0VYN0_CYCAE|nr:unnamed protein product [Cyclocybe aegerita]
MDLRPPSSPRPHAAFAVMSRLISCLVTEQILRAFYIPFNEPVQEAVGFLVVLSVQLVSEKPILRRALRSEDIFVMVPLHHLPTFKDHRVSKQDHGQLVGLVDPLDMLPYVYELKKETGEDVADPFVQAIHACLLPPPWDLRGQGMLRRVEEPVHLWQRFADGVFIPESLRDVIKGEIQSSFDWQVRAYQNPPTCPGIDSSPITWEQSLVAGHPTHPMHRARMLASSPQDYDWYRPRIRFVRVPRSDIDALGNFVELSKLLVARAFEKAGHTLDQDDAFIHVPVHELQIENILTRFRNVEVLDPTIFLPALAQSSIRTVVVPDFPGIALKLAVGVKISSSLRTISHFTANFGPRFSTDVVPKLAVDPNILSVELEPGSAVYHTSDPEVAKHFTAVIREEYQAPEEETLIVCAALLETDHAGTPSDVSAVHYAFALDTQEKREAFLDRYIQLACRALLPALIKNGVAFEAHAQNVLARFDKITKELKGFVIRDLGGLRIHPSTLRDSTGVDFQFLPGHCVATETLEETFPKFYHTFVHNHIQRLIRLLGLHYNGLGWEMLRKHMAAVIPKDHPVWAVWMDPRSTSVNSKCLMRMRMRDSYRDMVYSPYPNMIQFRSAPDQEPCDDGWSKRVFLLFDRIRSFITMYRPT